MEKMLPTCNVIAIALTALSALLFFLGVFGSTLGIGESGMVRIGHSVITHQQIYLSALKLFFLGVVALVCIRRSELLFWFLVWPVFFYAWASFYPDSLAAPKAQSLPRPRPTADPAAFTEMPWVPVKDESQVRALIDVTKPDDTDHLRSELIRYIWKRDQLPLDEQPAEIRRGATVDSLRQFKHLSRADAIEIAMEHGFRAVVAHLHPKHPNDELIVYHGGHTPEGFKKELNVVKRLLEEGYAVLAYSMPGTGENQSPIWVKTAHAGFIQILQHQDYALLESRDFSPIKLFLHPVVVGINYVEKEYDYRRISMVGLSGGGWTTTLCAAIDPRITRSYPVAGTLPFYLRPVSPKRQHSIGDYEQWMPPLYRRANYLELYVLGASGEGRRQLQILNQFDDCCFSGIGALSYGSVVTKTVGELGAGGVYDLHIDPTHKEHIISPAALDRIIDDLRR